MTTQELIEKLKTLPPDTEVIVWDAYKDCAGMMWISVLDGGRKHVVITHNVNLEADI